MKEWALCYAGAVVFGALGWWATGSQWAGFGIVVIFTACFVLVLKARKGAAEPQVISTEGMTRQQRRAHERKNK